ncbi:MAG TPA: Trk system potassium transporter TrkA [Ottowia sp.]|uniref:Trk system potassium transporter TrkA n=1 Tax=Ottowia sp. TaxID=1898956 RepID=UPI002CE6D45B|nr:Trk system potassium transporter TrkA [Ottowia sp.]HMN21757.1 Trk system potassium transporter TrkA [Ottowia sp.]
MRILIVGAGRVGESVAETMVSEANDITVIDQDPQRLRALEERLDLRGVAGNGTLPSVLRGASAGDCDLFIACTGDDATNLVACKVAHDVFGIPSTIARLRSSEFRDSELLGKEGFAVDSMICPEESVTRYIQLLIDYPGALQVVRFSQGQAHLAVVRVASDSGLAGHSIAEFRQQHPDLPMRIVAVYRQDAELPLGPDTRVLAGDEIFVLVGRESLRPALQAIGNPDRRVRRVMIVGGGRVGLRLARQLAGRYEVKIFERDHKRCEYLASELPPDMLVLEGDGSDEELLLSEHVGEMDLFIALTSDDEDNIMASMLAKRMGVRRAITLINRRAYAEMLQGSTIDIAISPAQAVIGELLMHVRRGAVAAVHSLRRGMAEALEGIARGDASTSHLVGRRIDQLKLPAGARVGALVRGEDDDAHTLVPRHDTVIEEGDHVIIFLPHKRMVRQAEKLFEVRATFF